MKTIKYILAVCPLVLGFHSCCDEPDKYETTDGVPTIRYIRNLGTEITTSTDPSDKVLTNGQLVESASPEATLCIVGDNLRSIVELYFNDKPATLNSSYITDNTMIVVVPKEVPTAVTNLITMKTADGQEVTHPFKVVISAPVLNSADCEYKRIGETMTGKEFSDRILSVFDRDLAHAKCAACDARKNVVSITRKLGDLYEIKWRESK